MPTISMRLTGMGNRRAIRTVRTNPHLGPRLRGMMIWAALGVIQSRRIADAEAHV